MGLYPIDCPQCKKPFMWFSGIQDQRCGECRGIIPNGVEMTKPIDLDSARHIHDANESLDEIVELFNGMTQEQLYALDRKEAAEAVKLDPTITLAQGPDDFDSKNIYLRRTVSDTEYEIIGLHAVGHAGPYSYDLHKLDGTVEKKTSNFMALETWGNEYDDEHNMLGRGSFRLHNSNIDDVAKEFEAEGWTRYEGPKRKDQNDKT